MDVAVEHERKLDADEGFELPELGGEPLERRVFTSVYYDTAERSLARSGITLRRRTEHGNSVWQLKLPASGARLELAVPGGPAAVPGELAQLLHAHLRHGPVVPVAELRTRRHGALVARNGTTAEVTVDEVSIMDALRVADGFTEVEIELRSGDPKRLDDIADEIADAGAHRSDGLPKVFRALGIGVEHDETGSAFASLVALLRTQLAEILAHDPGTRLGRDPESLHDMRVATRRSRALLHAGRTLVADDTTDLDGELKWLGGILGSVRDLDVLLGRLQDRAAKLGAPDAADARPLLRTLQGQRSRARRTLIRALDSDRYLSLLDRFETELDTLQPSEGGESLEELAQKQMKKLRKAADPLGEDPADNELHAVRKRGKRARYAAELAGHNKIVRRAKQLQDVLGEHQDAVVAEAALRKLAADAPSAQALAAGRLIDGERERRAEARRTWRKQWQKLKRAAK
ncbi:MAG TPA: CYTH and CHAD domain-containing protein [Gaiellaceae bacterium]|nr:CYTH and CHAD domain-containing protein [Gaiellaceae bacterium]